MSALPTAGRVVLVALEADTVPAIVLRVGAGGGVTVVAFSELWPLSPARIMRELPHVDTLRLGGKPPAWAWPPRGVEVSPDGRIVPPPIRELVAANLEREHAALVRAIAELAGRVQSLEDAAHNARLGDAGDVATMFGLLERRLERLEGVLRGVGERVSVNWSPP